MSAYGTCDCHPAVHAFRGDPDPCYGWVDYPPTVGEADLIAAGAIPADDDVDPATGLTWAEQERPMFTVTLEWNGEAMQVAYEGDRGDTPESVTAEVMEYVQITVEAQEAL